MLLHLEWHSRRTISALVSLDFSQLMLALVCLIVLTELLVEASDWLDLATETNQVKLALDCFLLYANYDSYCSFSKLYILI